MRIRNWIPRAMAKPEKPRRMTEEEWIEAILVFLYQAETPSCNIKQIADGIGVNQNSVPKYLNLMLDKFIKLQISGPTKLYYLTAEGRARAEEILTHKKG